VARVLGEVHISTRQGGANNTVIVTVTHGPTGESAEALAHSRREAKAMAYQRLEDREAVKAWLAEGVS